LTPKGKRKEFTEKTIESILENTKGITRRKEEKATQLIELTAKSFRVLGVLV
jgi:hypothetical protein